MYTIVGVYCFAIDMFVWTWWFG